jgi:hypothetical protein
MRYTLGIICSIILVGSAFAQTSVKSIFKPGDVSASISALSHLISDTTSSEDADQRKVIHHTAKDGQESVIVFFTIGGQGGGGNMYMHYLAVFSCLNYGVDHKGYRPSLVDYRTIGGKLWREIQTETAKIRGEGQTLIIEVDVLGYKKADPATDPTLRNKARFAVLTVPGARIEEQPPPLNRKKRKPPTP